MGDRTPGVTFSYAAKAHPELSQNDTRLVFTYNTNENTPKGSLPTSAKVYTPRFLEIDFQICDSL